MRQFYKFYNSVSLKLTDENGEANQEIFLFNIFTDFYPFPRCITLENKLYKLSYFPAVMIT